MLNARRDVLKFLGGSAAAVAFTPVPWKTLDDISIWSQNWSWIPRPVRGEISYKPAACTLCPMGCAVRVRCSGKQPVAVLPAADNGLCAYGLAAHQMAYHPGRVASKPADEALNAVKRAIAAEQSIAVLDAWPGRVSSSMYSRFAESVKNGVYLSAYPTSDVGPDLRRVHTLVSFGAPVLEDWGPPNLLLRRRDEIRVIYVGSQFSLTAEMADRWVPAMNSELMEEMKTNGPSVAVGNGFEVDHINQTLGENAALVHRRETAPQARSISGVPDRSIHLLIAETPSVPFEAIKPKLAPDAVVIAFAAWPNDYTAVAKYVLPLAAPFETVEDVPASFDAPAASFRLSPALMPKDVMAPADFLAQTMPSLGSLEENRKARIAAIHKDGRGTIAEKPVKGMTLDEFTTALQEGGIWVDDEYRPKAVADLPHAPNRRQLLTPKPLLSRRLA